MWARAVDPWPVMLVTMRSVRSGRDAGARLLLELVVVGFMGLVGLAAHLTGIAVVLFPELAALSQDVLLRPRGEWARQPAHLILAPTITAVFGLFCARRLHYGVGAILLIVLFSLAVIRLLRCSVSPAISAGVLPLMLNEHSRLYPVAIFLDLSVLTAILMVRKRYAAVSQAASGGEASGEEDRDAQILDAMERAPRGRYWLVALLGFVLAAGALAQITGLRFLLFPPLIVMGYELFGHPEVPGWMSRPVLLPVVCLITAGMGVAAERYLHPGFLAVMMTVLCSVGVLRLFDLHMPPALAIGMIPFVMEHPDARYAASVFCGTAALTLSYLGYQRGARRSTRQAG